MPTLAEYSAAHAFNPWLSVILPGDLAGCAVLVGLLRLPRTGVLIYLLLTSAEALCCASGVPLTAQLVWWVDLVPTLLVLTLVLRLKLRNRSPALA
jgi:CHASE2 domain-containing sensor protein